ncbi:unnamed protein product [Jaminaea pallidilutea]
MASSAYYTNAATVPPNPTTARGSSTKISVSPKADRLIYCNGRSVIIRPLPSAEGAANGPTIIYSQHPQPVTVARISPSGAYAASADQSGLVRIWDLFGDEQILKAEYRPFAGAVRDLAWDSESKRIAVVGQGKERFGHFFLMDSGSSCGEVSGHAKVINAVALKSTRPFRAVTGGDDNKVVLYNGVPYKYVATKSEHNRFVQSVAYSPDGTLFASAGSDSMLYIYDGPTGDLKQKVDVKSGTLFDIEFTADSKSVVSVGADGLARQWSAIDGSSQGQWDFKAGLPNAGDQLVAVALAGQQGIALNLQGEFLMFDLKQSGAQPARYLNPTKGITTAVRVNSKEIIAASWDGNLYRYLLDGAQWRVSNIHGAHVGSSVATHLALGPHGEAFAIGMDDTLRKIKDGKVQPTTTPLPGAGKGLAVSEETGICYVVTSDNLFVLPSGSNSGQTQKLPFSATAVAVSSDATLVAVGAEDGRVHLYNAGSDGSTDTSKPKSVIERNRSAITALSFRPNVDGGSAESVVLASADSSGKILVVKASDGSLLLNNWVFHTSRIHSLRWSHDGKNAISGGLDTHWYVWSYETPTQRREVKNAHAGGVSWVDWVDVQSDGPAKSQVASLGTDGALKIWAPR